MRKYYVTPAFSGVPTYGDKIKSGSLNHAFSGAHKWADVLRNPWILGGSRNKETKSKLAAAALPSRGPKSGRKCYVTLAFSGVPKQRHKIKSG